MKKPRALLTILSVLLLGLPGCKAEKESIKWGEPTYSWNSDYSKCTATRISLNDDSKAESEEVDSVYAIITPAKCESDGLGRYTATFSNPAFKTQTHNLTIEPTNHLWGKPTYSWTEDYSSCTAQRICSNDDSHKEIETVNSSYEIINTPTYIDDGLGRYTATFSNPAFTEQIQNVSLSKIDKLIYTKHEFYYSVKAASQDIPGDVIVPSSYNDLPVTTIEYAAFKGCSNVSSIVISDGITSIGDQAFQKCSNLTSISIPNSLKELGAGCFIGCNSLPFNDYENCKYIGNSQNHYLILVEATDRTLLTYNINPNCKLLAPYCFENCQSALLMEIQDGVRFIGCNAFSGCSSLVTYKAPFVGETEVSNQNMLYIFGSVPNTLTTIIITGENFSTIPERAFYQCYNLTSIQILNSDVKVIKKEAFGYCYNLPSFEIKNTINTIEEGAFLWCTSFEKISIPSSVSTMGLGIFGGCSNLSEITVESLQFDKFAYLFSTDTNYPYSAVPASLKKVVINGTSAPSFYHCSNIEEISLNCEEISNDMFSHCSSINKIYLSNRLKMVWNAFQFCSVLKDIYYSGTTESWNQNVTVVGYMQLSNPITVHCSNGNLNLYNS